MNKKSSWAGPIIVLISIAFMLYYYLVYRHSLEDQIRDQHTVIGNSANI